MTCAAISQVGPNRSGPARKCRRGEEEGRKKPRRRPEAATPGHRLSPREQRIQVPLTEAAEDYQHVRCLVLDNTPNLAETYRGQYQACRAVESTTQYARGSFRNIFLCLSCHDSVRPCSNRSSYCIRLESPGRHAP